MIMRSLMFGGLRQVLIAPAPFVMTPLILHRIGVAGYGTWRLCLRLTIEPLLLGHTPRQS
jgi:hypothetical protein